MPLNTQQVGIVEQAAHKYGVPPAIGLGVWGMETDYGQNVKTSSAGAVGDFQFLPSTARSYGYPLTNNPSTAQFTQQADAAMRYLATLNRQHGGDWNAALKAYSGGGYGLPQVQAKADPFSSTGGFTPSVSNLPGASTIAGAASSVADVGNAIGSVWSAVTTPALWKRVLYFIGGAVLLFWGLKELAGAHVPQSVKTAAAVAA